MEDEETWGFDDLGDGTWLQWCGAARDVGDMSGEGFAIVEGHALAQLEFDGGGVDPCPVGGQIALIGAGFGVAIQQPVPDRMVEQQALAGGVEIDIRRFDLLGEGKIERAAGLIGAGHARAKRKTGGSKQHPCRGHLGIFLSVTGSWLAFVSCIIFSIFVYNHDSVVLGQGKS